MSSKIQGYGPQPPAVSSGTRGAPVASTGEVRKVDATRPAGDAVTLTESARQLQRLEDAVARAPEVDEARVEAIRQALAQGRYEVDAERVAERLLAADRELPGR